MPHSDYARISYVRGRAWKPDLERLHKAGLSDRAIARELSRLYAPATFSRRMIRYYRAEDDRLAQDGECVPRDYSSLEHRRAVHQMLKGFGHLLPLPLRKREADILALLKERGPMTRQEIREALGVGSLHTQGQKWMQRLLNLALIEVVGFRQTFRRPRRLYAATARALPQAEHTPGVIRPLHLEPLRVACG